MRRALLVLAFLGVGSVANPEDVRNRRPSTHFVPGFYEGNYAAESALNVLPDVITSSVDLLTPVRSADSLVLTHSADSLVPERTVEKR